MGRGESRVASTDKTQARFRGMGHTSEVDDIQARRQAAELRELRELRMEPQVLEKAAVALWTMPVDRYRYR